MVLPLPSTVYYQVCLHFLFQNCFYKRRCFKENPGSIGEPQCAGHGSGATLEFPFLSLFNGFGFLTDGFPRFPILDSLDSLFLVSFSLFLSYLIPSLLETRSEGLIRSQRNILGRDLSGVVLCASRDGRACPIVTAAQRAG